MGLPDDIAEGAAQLALQTPETMTSQLVSAAEYDGEHGIERPPACNQLDASPLCGEANPKHAGLGTRTKPRLYLYPANAICGWVSRLRLAIVQPGRRRVGWNGYATALADPQQPATVGPSISALPVSRRKR